MAFQRIIKAPGWLAMVMGYQSMRAFEFFEFFTGATADRQLQQLTAWQHLKAAAHGAGMAVPGSQPGVAQVGMGIELNQDEFGVAFGHSGDGAGADRMFAAKHEWLQA